MKKLLPDLIAILAFVLLSFAYFFPADIENRILFQHDTAAGAGAGQEVKEYYEQTGERSRMTPPSHCSGYRKPTNSSCPTMCASHSC